MSTSTRVLLCALVVAACAVPVREDAGDEIPDAGPPASACAACVTSDECSGGVCAQFRTDNGCVKRCSSDGDCASGEACVPLATVEGSSVRACRGASDPCAGASSGTDGPDAGTPARADAGTSSTGGSPADAGTPAVGGEPSGHIDAHAGGTTGRLFFVVIGDTRPARIDDTAAYPSATIEGIYRAVSRLSPLPDFAVSTGDYMFASTSGNEAGPQLALYLQARSVLDRPLWAALGNHECTGATASNCGTEAGRTTPNYEAFLTRLMGPLGETLPYYVRRVDDAAGRWTAKVVVVAPNAWGPVQEAWLDRTLAVPTTYTFVVHHEPAAATQAPGMNAVNRLVQAHPVTLSIVGHTHTWEHQSREVVCGNGGAPLTTASVPYGFTRVEQRADGDILVQAVEASNGHVFASFAVHPDGSSAP